MVPINSRATLSSEVPGLDKYTEYEFQVLAFTSVGDGPKSSVEVERTMEDGKNLESASSSSLRKKASHLFYIEIERLFYM